MKFALAFLAVLFSGWAAFAQSPEADTLAVVPEGYEMVDSLVYVPQNAVDSLLDGESVWDVLPSGVDVHVSKKTMEAFEEHLAANRSKQVPCFRIRIFFDNKQDSREESDRVLSEFRALHPGMAAYRTFQNPFFKVTVGDFRTRSEALAELDVIRGEFPSSFIVKEKMRYPSVGVPETFRVDTVRVLRPISVPEY